MARPPPLRGKPEYSDAAARFLLLVGAARMHKDRLSERSGLSQNRLTGYENSERAPGDVFAKNSEFSKLAAAFNLLPSALVAWWATDDSALLPVYLRDQIEAFRALSAREKMQEWRLLGWQRPRGKQPKLRSAPPRADD